MAVSNENPFGKMKPSWNSVYVNENSSQRVYEVELENPERVLTKLGRPDRSTLGKEEKRHMIRLLIFENRITGKILYASYMSVESGDGTVPKDFHYKKVGAFSGTVLFYHFGGALSNGWDYENGKIVRQITAISKSDFDLLSQSGPKGKVMALVTTCNSGYAEKFKWACVGVPGYQDCGWTSAGYEYVTVCTTREASDDPNTEDDGGPSGDYIPPIYIDCAGVENGSAYWNSGCETCMGGTTGVNECNADTITNIQNTCIKQAVKMAFNSGLKNRMNTIFANTILANHDLYLTVKDTVLADSVNGDFRGFFTRPGSVRPNFTGTIRLNSNVLDSASNEFTVSIMYHEVLHAYLARLFGTGTPLSISNIDHETMANQYVASIKTALMEQFPDLDSGDANALAWAGLHGTALWQLKTPVQQSSILQTVLKFRKGLKGHKCR